MKSALSLLVTILSLLALVLAVKPAQKSILVTFPASTPDHIVDDMKRVVEDAGGFVTHTYKLIKGFAATTPAKGLELLNTFNTPPEYKPTVEEDQVVTIQ